MNHSPLGRGLSALLGENTEAIHESTEAKNLVHIEINHVFPGKMQPRKDFNQETLGALASSISEKGILQPLLIRWLDEKKQTAEIIAGERRWRAAKIAGVQNIPAIVVDYSDQECLEVGLVENLQRDDLNPVEEAESLKKLIQDYNRTQEEVAQAVGKSRSYVANALRLLSLPESVQDRIRKGELSPGHARTLINNEHAEQLAQRMVDEKMTVRDAEAWQKNQYNNDQERNPDLAFLEKEIYRLTGMSAKLKTNKNNGGEIRLKFENISQLDALIRKISI